MRAAKKVYRSPQKSFAGSVKKDNIEVVALAVFPTACRAKLENAVIGEGLTRILKLILVFGRMQ
jgi:hypothetical protein